MLAFVICGVEHSGTTLISEIFRQVPMLDSGFETGVLLSETPSQFLQEMPFATTYRRGLENYPGGTGGMLRGGQFQSVLRTPGGAQPLH